MTRFLIRQYLALATVLLLSAPAVSADITDIPEKASLDATVTFFYYEDLEGAASFYENLLGLKRTMDEDWVKIFEITPNSSVGLVADGRGFHPVSVDKPAMLSFVTDDVDSWYRLLVEADTVIRSELPPPGTEPDADSAPVRGFVAEDPGGYTIEFFTWQQAD